MEQAKTDVAVLLIFFNRPQQFGKVFEQVRQARPSRLFLYQDGPRGDADLPGIEACRAIAEKVDWQCDVRRRYEQVNHGCDPSEFIAQRWAFSLADRCIVLEDDDVPSLSFFPFCKELLDRYADDERVTMIAGFNSDEVTTDVGDDDYFFTSVFSIWGWASWRRVVERWDEHYGFLSEPSTLSRLENLIEQRRWRSDFLPMCRAHKAAGKAYYETIFWSHMMLQGGLAIMPRQNQVNNIGVTADSTHFTSSTKTLPRRFAKQFTMKRFEQTFPLHHPKYVFEHVAYKDRVYRRNAWRSPWRKVAYSLEELWRNLLRGNFSHIGRSLSKRIGKWLHRD